MCPRQPRVPASLEIVSKAPAFFYLGRLKSNPGHSTLENSDCDQLPTGKFRLLLRSHGKGESFEMQTIRITPEEKVFSDKENHILLPETIGRGGVRMLRLDSGIQLSLSDYRLNSSTVMEYTAFPGVFGFGFCLSGDILSQPAGFKSSDEIHAGQNALFYFDRGKMRETVSSKRVIRLNIMFEPNRLQCLFENAPEEILSVLNDLSSNPQRIFGSVTTAMRSAIRQVFDCPYSGLVREFYLESKVLELIAYKLNQFEGESSRILKLPGFKDEDLDRAAYAGQLMARDLESPPDLAELARRVGMCQSKLCRCFREVYGMSPFDYLRSKRLDTAEQYLRQGRMNVTQVAFSVGYSSLSHFSKAFKRHTGLLPRQCQGQRGFAGASRDH